MFAVAFRKKTWPQLHFRFFFQGEPPPRAGIPRRMEAFDGGSKWLKMRVFPTTADGALQVLQSPCQWSSPGPADAECSVVAESRCRIAPPLALTQREKFTAGSPKSAVSPCPPRRDRDAARTESFLGTRAVAHSLFSTHGTVYAHVLHAPCIVLGAWLDPGPSPHVRAGWRFVQCFEF